jgi:hypothetical protein
MERRVTASDGLASVSRVLKSWVDIKVLESVNEGVIIGFYCMDQRFPMVQFYDVVRAERFPTCTACWSSSVISYLRES